MLLSCFSLIIITWSKLVFLTGIPGPGKFPGKMAFSGIPINTVNGNGIPGNSHGLEIEKHQSKHNTSHKTRMSSRNSVEAVWKCVLLHLETNYRFEKIYIKSVTLVHILTHTESSCDNYTSVPDGQKEESNVTVTGIQCQYTNNCSFQVDKCLCVLESGWWFVNM